MLYIALKLYIATNVAHLRRKGQRDFDIALFAALKNYASGYRYFFWPRHTLQPGFLYAARQSWWRKARGARFPLRHICSTCKCHLLPNPNANPNINPCNCNFLSIRSFPPPQILLKFLLPEHSSVCSDLNFFEQLHKHACTVLPSLHCKAARRLNGATVLLWFCIQDIHFSRIPGSLG